MSMLARVASNLFWIGRYLERAENIARLLDTGRRMAALPSADGNRNEWESVLASSGTDFLFPEDWDQNSHRDVVQYLALSMDNPSSIYNCIKKARESFRSTREGMSSDSWRATNEFWLDFKDFASRPVDGPLLADLIERTKFGCMMIVGAIESTVLRNESYDFLKLGTFIERTDNTARILDVKYFSLLPPDEKFEGGVDTFQWMTILDATSTRRLFRRLYGADLRAARVVELLLQNRHCARSLAFCVDSQRSHLSHLAEVYSKESNSELRANQLFTSVSSANVEEVILSGLHEYLGECIRANNAIADQIAVDFHFMPSATQSQSSRAPSEH